MAWRSGRRYLLNVSWLFSFHREESFELANYQWLINCILIRLFTNLNRFVLDCSDSFNKYCYFFHITALLHVSEGFGCKFSERRGVVRVLVVSDGLAHYIHAFFVRMRVRRRRKRWASSGPISFSCLISRCILKGSRKAILHHVVWLEGRGEARLIFESNHTYQGWQLKGFVRSSVWADLKLILAHSWNQMRRTLEFCYQMAKVRWSLLDQEMQV